MGYQNECKEHLDWNVLKTYLLALRAILELLKLIEYSFKKRTALDKLLDDLFWSKGERKENESFTNRVSLF